MPRTMKYYQLDRPAKEMSAAELIEILGDAGNAEIIRSLAMNEREHLSPTVEDRSLRGFWYSTVKPVLTKLGKLDTVVGEDSLTAWDQELSRHLGTIVKLGILDYSDLKIVDTSRPRACARNHYHVDSRALGYQVANSQHPNVILCTEKDTAYSIVRQVATITGCSCLSGSGQGALSATESLLKEIPAGDRRHLLYLSVTDYDSAGYSIAEVFASQARDYAKRLGIKTIHSDRLGILPSQLSSEEIAQNRYRPKPGKTFKDGTTELDRWVKETGGIDGEPFGLELDAFPAARLRLLFVQALGSYIDVDTSSTIATGYLRARALDAIKPAITAALDRITVELADRIRIKPHDIWELVADGWDHLPVAELVEGDLDPEIKRRAIAYLVDELDH